MTLSPLLHIVIDMGKGNIFSNIFSSIFSAKDPEAAKKKQLKNIIKELSKSKYHFYKASSHEVQPAFAKTFYDIYKAVAPAQAMFQNTNPKALKNVVIMASLSDHQKSLIEEMTEESINQMARTMKIADLKKKIKADSDQLASEFDSAKITSIDSLYTNLVIFMHFCQFDFYFTLRKFDNTLKERDFSSLPHFAPINGSYVVEDIKNFISVAWTVPFTANWNDVFQLLRGIKGVEPVTMSTWKKILSLLSDIKERRIFEMIVQLLMENPDYSENLKMEEYHIVDEYISSIKKQASATIENVQKRQHEGKVDSFLTQIFGNSSVQPLKYYNEAGSAPLERKNIGSLVWQAPLSQLKQFLVEYTKKEIRELSDILLVRGEWTNQQMATPMSEAYHELLEISEKVLQFDEEMSDERAYGLKIKTLLPRADRDKESRNTLTLTLKDANNIAAELLISATKSYVIYAKNLKIALEDFVKNRPELILNWKELDHFAENRLKDMCIDVYKKIYLFVSLIQSYNVQIEE